MNELIKISTHNGGNVVSARDLWTFLKSKKDFSSWIKHRITKYGLIENKDFVILPQMGEFENQRLRIEYALSFDAAKELSMVEGNAKGKEARIYFIEKEKELIKLKNSTPAKPLSVTEMFMQSALALQDQEKRLIAVEEKVKQIESHQPAAQEENMYFTIMGYSALVKKSVDITMAANLGRRATAMCNEMGFITGSMPDPRFGRVKTYPKSILEAIFNNHHK